MKTKVCIWCKSKKSLDCFYKQAKDREDYHPQCKSCRNIYAKKQRKLYPERFKAYDRKVNKERRGLTEEQFDGWIKLQCGLCAICGLPEIDKNRYGVKDLAIDHNHNTEKVRGLLCAKCNRALGLLNVDNLGILNLQKAIQYLLGDT